MPKPQTRPRLFRYEIDAVDGDVPVEVGTVIVDKWKADRTWSVHNFDKSPSYVGSWHAKLLGEAPDDVAAQVYAQWGI